MSFTTDVKAQIAANELKTLLYESRADGNYSNVLNLKFYFAGNQPDDENGKCHNSEAGL